MLFGVFAFANEINKAEIISFNKAVELIQTTNNVGNIQADFIEEKGCLITFTFILEDGSIEKKTVLVSGVSCKELGL